MSQHHSYSHPELLHDDSIRVVDMMEKKKESKSQYGPLHKNNDNGHYQRGDGHNEKMPSQMYG
jgi:hypothetical protein